MVGGICYQIGLQVFLAFREQWRRNGSPLGGGLVALVGEFQVQASKDYMLGRRQKVCWFCAIICEIDHCTAFVTIYWLPVQ